MNRFLSVKCGSRDIRRFKKNRKEKPYKCIQNSGTHQRNLPTSREATCSRVAVMGDLQITARFRNMGGWVSISARGATGDSSFPRRVWSCSGEPVSFRHQNARSYKKGNSYRQCWMKAGKWRLGDDCPDGFLLPLADAFRPLRSL